MLTVILLQNTFCIVTKSHTRVKPYNVVAYNRSQRNVLHHENECYSYCTKIFQARNLIQPILFTLSAAWSRGLKRRFYGDRVITSRDPDSTPTLVALLRPWKRRFTMIISVGGFEQAAN